MTLATDREDQNYRARTSAGTTDDQKFGAHYAYLDYKFADPFSVRFGQYKLPLSRISRSSSARRLIVERPFSSDDAKGLFGDYEQVELMLHDSVAGGIFKYMLATADGSGQNRAGATYANADAELAYIGRVEFSPPGMTEKGQSDAHLGKGRHLTFGLNAGSQGGVKSNGGAIETDRKLMGADLSFHLGGFTAQAEYNACKVGGSGALLDLEPKDWYVQASYFIPAEGHFLARSTARASCPASAAAITKPSSFRYRSATCVTNTPASRTVSLMEDSHDCEIPNPFGDPRLGRCGAQPAGCLGR